MSQSQIKSLENDKIASKDIKNALNSSYPIVLESKTKNAIKTIVDALGGGDFLTIQEAVKSGSEYIFVKNGEYTISEDLELENQTIEGQSNENCIINLENASIVFKEITNKATNGTLQFFQDDKSVDGDNTAFLNLSSNNEFKYCYSEGRLLRIASIQDSTALELRSKYFGTVRNPVDNTILQLGHTTFESKANNAGIKNIKINHVIDNPKETIILNGVNTFVKNVNFFNDNNLSNFVKVSKSNITIAVNSGIEDCFFEGGAIGVLINKAYNTKISRNYFTNLNDRCIELKSSSEETDISNNTFSSGLFGVIQNAKYVNYKNNIFKFMSNNSISINSSKFTDEQTFTKVINCKFSKGTTDTSFTNDGALLIRGKGTIVSGCFFDDGKIAIQLNCEYTIVNNCTFTNNQQFYAINLVSGKNNNIITDCTFYDFMLENDSGNKYVIIDSCTVFGEYPPLNHNGESAIFSNNTILASEFYIPKSSIAYGNYMFEGEVYITNKSIALDNNIDEWFLRTDSAGEKAIIINNAILRPDFPIEVNMNNCIVCNNFVENDTTTVQDNATGTQIANNYY